MFGRTLFKASRSIRCYSYSSIPKVDSKEAFQKVFKKPGLSVFDFFATWCGPCKAMAPILGKLQQENPKASFYKIDVDENVELAQELGVTAMPTFLLTKEGNVLVKVVGADPHMLEKAIKKHI